MRVKKMVADSKVIVNNFAKTIYCKFICCLVWLLASQEKTDPILHSSMAQILAE